MTLNETSFPARDRLNERLVRQVRYTGPTSYATGGDPVNGPTELGMGEVYAVSGNIISDGVTTRIAWFDYVNQKLVWFVPSTNAEVANTTNLSTFVGVLTFYGKG